MDVFRVKRIVCGHDTLREEIERGGASGLLERSRIAPEAPPSLDDSPPPVPGIRDRIGRRFHWDDESAVAVRSQQDAWYEWQTHVTWASAWDQSTPTWQLPLEELRHGLSTFTSALEEFASRNPKNLQRRWTELSADRIGVSYILPPGADGMERFYQRFFQRLREWLVQEGRVHQSAQECDVFCVLVGRDAWADAFSISTEESPELATSYLRKKATAEIKHVLHAAAASQQPILPRLHELLIEAALAWARPGDYRPGIPEYFPGQTGQTPVGKLRPPRPRPPQDAHHIPRQGGRL